MAALTGRGGGEGGEAGRQPPPAGQRIGPTGAGGRAVLEVVMLHEGTRALAVARGIRDTSAEGERCHSRRFAALAASMGLARPDLRPGPVVPLVRRAGIRSSQLRGVAPASQFCSLARMMTGRGSYARPPVATMICPVSQRASRLASRGTTSAMSLGVPQAAQRGRPGWPAPARRPGWAWDLRLYLVCPQPDLMGTDPGHRSFQDTVVHRSA